MEFAPIDKVVLGSIAFAVFWILAVFPSVSLLPIGRTAGSLLGAVLMIVFKVVTPDEAFESIDLPVLGLLFGTMLVSLYLERADMFKYLGQLLSWKCRGPKDLMCRICVISALSSALFTNDTCCIVLTEFVLSTAKENNVPPHPFLLALATSSNIGSSATPIGNPQNLVIATMSKISFGQFLVGILPSMAVGILVNMMILLVAYWRTLAPTKKVMEAELEEGNISAQTNSTPSSLEVQESSETTKDPCFHGPQERDDILAVENAETKEDSGSNSDVSMQQSTGQKGSLIPAKWRRLASKISTYSITTGMLVALLMGLNMSWTVITASLILVVLDFKDAAPCFDKVSYSILLLFCGMFIAVEGFNETGIPSALWDVTKPHAEINHVSGMVVLSLVILVLSNVASNVPTVLLLGGRVAAQAALVSASQEKKAWLVLAWVSTVAGNLSLPGSAANLIVCEQARRAQSGKYTLSFWTHLKFGLPSTLVVTAIGLLLIRG